ncbi:MAG TPA: NDP-sugar synthase [Dehalococcoidia bacterium]
MKAVVLAGGMGTRLRPLTYGRPKSMVPILNRPFLEHCIAHLRRHGVTEVILALSYLPEAIEGHFGDGRAYGVRITYVLEETPLGSGGAIRNVAHLLDGTFFALNGDVYTDLDLSAMLARHREAGAAVSISLTPVADPSHYGVVDWEPESGRLRRFVEKPPREEAPSNMANAGTWIFEPWVLDRIPADRPSMVERELFPDLLREGQHLLGFASDAYWIDIGTPERYLQVHRDLLTGAVRSKLDGDAAYPHVDPGASVAGGATVTGPVLVGAGARIEEGCRLEGPLVIGPGTVVGAGSHLSGCVLWEQVRVGPGATLRDAVVGARCVVGEGAALHGVYLGDGATVEGGAVLGPGTPVPAAPPAEG